MASNEKCASQKLLRGPAIPVFAHIHVVVQQGRGMLALETNGRRNLRPVGAWILVPAVPRLQSGEQPLALHVRADRNTSGNLAAGLARAVLRRTTRNRTPTRRTKTKSGETVANRHLWPGRADGLTLILSPHLLRTLTKTTNQRNPHLFHVKTATAAVGARFGRGQSTDPIRQVGVPDWPSCRRCPDHGVSPYGLLATNSW